MSNLGIVHSNKRIRSPLGTKPTKLAKIVAKGPSLIRKIS